MMKKAMQILFLILSLTAISASEDTCQASDKDGGGEDCGGGGVPLTCVPYDPSAASIIYREQIGWLGNQLGTVLLLKSMQLYYGYKPFLSRFSQKFLEPLFGDLRMDVAEDSLCEFEQVATKYRAELKAERFKQFNRRVQERFKTKAVMTQDDQDRWYFPDELQKHKKEIEQLFYVDPLGHFREVKMTKSQYPWEVFSERPLHDLADPGLQKGKVLNLYPEGYHYYAQESEFIFGAPGLVAELERSFTPRPKFIKAAEKTLAGIVKKHEKKQKEEDKGEEKKEWTFVGIHSRRTDHLAHEKNVGMIPLKAKYYTKSMDMFRKEFKNTIFVYISDDVAWGKQEFGTKKKKLDDLYFASKADNVLVNAEIGHDLALMSLCNHTIVSYGSFSFWVSFLAGGATIHPYHFPEYRNSELDMTIFRKNPLKNRLPRLHHFIN